MDILQQWRKMIDWVLPQFCLLCKNPAQRFQLCTACFRSLPWLTAACLRCAQPLSQQGLYCGACSKQPPPYHSTIALFSYASPIDHFILGLKFRKKLVYAQILGEMMAEKIVLHYQQSKPQYIIPIPLHRERMKTRGFNQAVEIAKPIARKLAIPLELNSAQRIIATQPQAVIAADQRWQNVNRAFSVNPSFQARHIALIDDVVTTANTITALSECYKQLGVQTIDIWCCAKTIWQRK